MTISLKDLGCLPEKKGVPPLIYGADEMDKQILIDMEQISHDTVITACEQVKLELDEESLARIMWENQPYLRYSEIEMKAWAKAIASQPGKIIKIA